MNRSIIAALVAALAVPALPALAQQVINRPAPVTGGTSALEETLANDRAQIRQDKAAIAHDQASGVATEQDRQKLDQSLEQQENDRDAEERGTGDPGDAAR